ncbi:MAG: NAD-dependent epimerase/dehydratase family protein, partial [Candidatus Caldarchaeum sp.]
MRMLVTGCAGFIGSHLTEALLEDGHEVIGVDSFEEYYARRIKEYNLKKALMHPRFTFVEGDLLRLDLAKILDGVDCVMHQAAVPGVRRSWGRHFQVYVDNNILATQILLEACKEIDLKRFVYASSSSVYGNADELPISESAQTMPFSPYGVSKLAGENLTILYHKNYGIPVIALRYFTIYGPRQRPDMSFHRFLLSIHLGREIEVYGDGRQTRDFTFVESAVRANLLAIGGGVSGEAYNIGGGSTIELLEA